MKYTVINLTQACLLRLVCALAVIAEFTNFLVAATFENLILIHIIILLYYYVSPKN